MANTLDKSGIINGQTIQPIHVTQTIDALTAADAYDITISGSLTLTGSVSSLNGFIGSLDGNSTTASYVASSPQNYLPNPGGAFVGPGNLGLIAGSTTLSSGVSPAINPTALTGKTFQTQYWVTTTKASGSTSPTASYFIYRRTNPRWWCFFDKRDRCLIKR
jgi:hypothetical protein